MTSSRTGRFLTSAFLIYAYQGASLLTGLWLAPFLLAHLGQHDFGVWLVGFQVVTYLMLLDFGIVALVPREVAYLTGRARATGVFGPEIALMVGQTARIVLYQTPLVLLACVGAWFLIPAGWNVYRGVVGLVLVTFVLTFPLRIFHAVLQGLQDVTFCGILNLATLVFGTTITAALVLRGFGLYALAVSWTANQALLFIASAYRLRSRYPEALPDRLPPMSSSTLRTMLGRGFWVSLNQITQPLLVGSDLLAVSKLAGAAAVVPYNSTGRLSGVLGNQPQVLMQMAVPGLSELKSGASKDHIYNVTMALGISVLILCGAIVCGVVAINQGFVTRWMGQAQYAGMLLTALLALCMLLRQYNLIAQFATFCCGHERRITIAVFIDGILTAGATFGFVWLLGPVGAPLGSILGVCLVSLPSNLKALGHETGRSVFALLTPLWTWFWRFMLVSAAAILASYLSPPLTIVEIAARGALTMLLYCSLMWPVAIRSPLGPYLQRIHMSVRMRFFGSSIVDPTAL